MALRTFLTKHKRSKGDVRPQTHTWFDTATSTLHIPDIEIPNLRTSLVEDVLQNPRFSGPRSITEKVARGKPFRFFVDLDLTPSSIQQWFAKNSQTDAKTSLSEVVANLRSIVHLLRTVVAETTASNAENIQMILATRLPYKIHVHFPNIIVNKDGARLITKAFVQRFEQEHPDFFSKNVVDESVYTTGLRLIYSHKGGMTNPQKRDIERQEHEAIWGKGSYCDSYHVTDLQTWKRDLEPRVADLEQTSIQVPDNTPLTYITSLTDNPTSRKGSKVSVREKKNQVGKIQPSDITPDLLLFLNSNFPVSADDIRVSEKTYRGDNLIIPTRSRQCPFAKREHNNNQLYFVITPTNIELRCHDTDCSESMSVPVETVNVQALQTVTAQTEESIAAQRMTAVTATLNKVKELHPKMICTFEPDTITASTLGGDGYMVPLKQNRWCPVCRREHDSPENCILTLQREQLILCNRDLAHPISVPLSQEHMKVIFNVQNLQINVGNFEDSAAQRKARDFGSYDSFPVLFETEEVNLLCYRSLSGDTYSIAKFLSHIVKNEALFVDGNWFTYTGKYWRKCNAPNAFFAETVVALYQNLMTHYAQDSHVKWLQNIVNNLSNHEPRKPFIRELEGILESSEDRVILDPNVALVCFKNGVYDTDSCTFREHRKEDYITEILPYDLPTQSDEKQRFRIEQFFTSIMPDKETRDFLLLYLALHLEGRNRHQIAVILAGEGGNGKGIIKAIMKVVFCDLHTEVQPAFLTSERPPDEKPLPGMLDLRVKRTFFASEPETDKKINGGFIKLLSGGDLIRCRACRSNEMVQFMPRFIPTVLCNTIPLFDCGVSEVRSIWRRMRIIWFPQKFVKGDAPLGPNEAREDPDLLMEIAQWGPEMMLKLIEVFERYVSTGRKLSEPPAVMEMVEQQKLENNPFARFLSLATRKHIGVNTHVHYVKERYVSWLASRKRVLQDKEAATTNKIGKRLQELGWQLGPIARVSDCTEECQLRRSSGPVVHNLLLVNLNEVTEE